MLEEFYNNVFKRKFDPEFSELTETQKLNLSKSLMFQSYEAEKAVLEVKDLLIQKFKKVVL